METLVHDVMNFIWILHSGDRALKELRLQKEKKEAFYEDEMSKTAELMEEKGIQILLDTISICISWGMTHRSCGIECGSLLGANLHYVWNIVSKAQIVLLKLLSDFTPLHMHNSVMSWVVIFWSMGETCWSCSYLLSHRFDNLWIAFTLVPCKELSVVFNG